MNLDELPVLALEQILIHLSLEDRLKSRGVSRGWRYLIDSFRVRSLCFSERPSGFILGKSRWVNGAFAQNFICSPQFEPFVNTFGQTILSNLRRLRLCELHYAVPRKGASLFSTLNSFDQLVELGLLRVKINVRTKWKGEFKLNLPLLRTIRLKHVSGIAMLTLDTPNLQEVRLEGSQLQVVIVHGDSVERVISEFWDCVGAAKLKNLKYLHYGHQPSWYLLSRESPYMPSLENLQEFHLDSRQDVREFFEQRRLHDRPDLKIFIYGLPLIGPYDDPVMSHPMTYHYSQYFGYMLRNASRLADEIPFCKSLNWNENAYSYAYAESTAELALSIANKFTNLNAVVVHHPVRDIERFLDFLKQFEHLEDLWIFCNQPQELFDRLPEHVDLQGLIIQARPSDFRFLFGLKNLIRLHVACEIDAEFIRRALKEFKFLTQFKSSFNHKEIIVEIDRSKRIRVCIGYGCEYVSDLDAAIQLIAPIE